MPIEPHVLIDVGDGTYITPPPAIKTGTVTTVSVATPAPPPIGGGGSVGIAASVTSPNSGLGTSTIARTVYGGEAKPYVWKGQAKPNANTPKSKPAALAARTPNTPQTSRAELASRLKPTPATRWARDNEGRKTQTQTQTTKASTRKPDEPQRIGTGSSGHVYRIPTGAEDAADAFHHRDQPIHGLPNRAATRMRVPTSATFRRPTGLSSVYDYTTPHRKAVWEAVDLIVAQAEKSSRGVSVAVRRNLPLAELPRNEIVIEPEYSIERASKRYRRTPIDELPASVRRGLADVIEFIPQRHRALIWEVKKSTVGGSPLAAAERASLEAEHYVGRFDASAEANAEGYRASQGTKFLGRGPVYDTRYADLLGAVLYDAGRKPEPPVREPHPFRLPDLSPDDVVALLLALAGAYRLRGGGGGGLPPEPVPVTFGRRFPMPSLLLEPPDEHLQR